MGLLLTLFLSFFMIGGALLAASAKDARKLELLSISIAMGSMCALLVLDLIPEAMENLGSYAFPWLPVFALAGIGLLKLLDHFIPEHDHAHGFDHHCSEENLIHIGVVSAIALILHNVIEGMAVYSVYGESTRMGAMMSLGIGLHNIPMGMVLYTTLEKETKVKKYILLSGACLSTFLGGVLMLVFWSWINEFIIGVLVSLTLGMLVFIIVFELAPHLMHAKEKKLALLGIAIGLAVNLISGFLGG